MAKGGVRPGAGRPKGSFAKSTLDAIAVRQLYADLAKEHGLEIAQALIEKAKKGDVAAIKEFHDRVFGKAPQAITGPEGGALKIIFDQVFNKDVTPSETEGSHTEQG